MREIFVAELIHEVLGPRHGIREVLDNPLNEYICGVLEPIIPVAIPPDIDDIAEPPIEEAAEGEEDAADADISPPPLSAPALNPQNRPHSMGLSFILKPVSGIPGIYICITWARYLRTDGGWRREPRYYISDLVLPRQGYGTTIWIDGNGSQTDQDRAEVSLHILWRTLNNDRYLVSIYLVNRLNPPQGQPITAEYHIFQPQIRVRCEENTRVVPGLERFPDSDEERELSFLYRNRPVLAKGHLCSAVWRQIDPESDPGNIRVDFPESLSCAPFHWIDGESLPENLRERFSPADCRTEFVPLYSVLSPDLAWPNNYGHPPELHTEILAESWDREIMGAGLDPLVDGYRQWINELEGGNGSLSPEEQEIATRLIRKCGNVADRIRRGIDLLLEDEDARLAFCFANKAMEIQSRWASGNVPLLWHPFQLAFILMTLESIARPDSSDRDICDLLWVPTGTGKTEAYLAIAAFTLAYRRRRALRRSSGDRTGAGISIISRYTLRLLTIQQFRRALRMVTACELLRVYGLASNNPTGWRPTGYPERTSFLWGTNRFSIGLWVGGGVTPNRLKNTWGNQTLYGALEILKGRSGEGEPAQVLNCPACNAILSVPETGLAPGHHVIHLVIHSSMNQSNLESIVASPAALSGETITVHTVGLHQHEMNGYYTLTIDISSSQGITFSGVDSWWSNVSQNAFSGQAELVSARASRSGYFLRWCRGQQGQRVEYDFDIFCPNPGCQLHAYWCEGTPSGSILGTMAHTLNPTGVPGINLPGNNRLTSVNDAFRTESPYICDRIPIPAYTVDDQIYHRCPSMVIATVDKFARPPFEPRASSLFGNVDHQHCMWGFYRQDQPPFTGGQQPVNGHPSPAGTRNSRKYVTVVSFDPPDVIIQDELHLLEGPLGSLVGMYETAVDYLCGDAHHNRIKYIASTATVRQAEEQVKAIFQRRLVTFPPSGLSAGERFFLRFFQSHSIDDTLRGQLYIGICAPGRGPLTPIVRIWTRLLHTAWQSRLIPGIDPFWTLTGYFNAIRELGGARALYRQDIPERVNMISAGPGRPLADDRCQELSSRTESTGLPAILDTLNNRHPDAQDVLFTTSMFGTGIDIPRLGLMVVHGQPKTTSAYIQATGRVGRSRGGLVVTFFRATRPRDLNHYEFFSGYHGQLHRFVEPITVMPFAAGVLDRACGPALVFILRNKRNNVTAWHRDDTAGLMASQRNGAAEVQDVPDIFEVRGQSQPPLRRPHAGHVQHFTGSELDCWQRVAIRTGQNLQYVEYAIASPPSSPVVLGDAVHQHAGLDVVYENAPQSLRDIEETAGFQT
jgi:hypothetical protein